MTTRATIAAILAAAGIAAAAPTVLAQQGGKPPAHSHGHTDVKPAEAYGEALRRIREQMRLFEALLAANTPGPGHDNAEAVSVLAKSLGRLALKPDSGVPREKVRDANIAGKDLAKLADQLHTAADNGDAAGCKRLVPEMHKLIAALAALTPEQWVCDMHCEPGKLYDAPGICPGCKMPFRPLAEVPYSANIAASPSPILPGAPAELTIRLIDPAGNIVALKDLEIVHEQPIHLLMVSSDLSWYAHEHPTPRPDGTFVLTMTFPAPGEYTVFHDFTPRGREQCVPQFKLKVQGAPPAPVPLVEDYDVVGRVDGYEFRVRCNGEKFSAGKDQIIRIGVDKDGLTVADLEPYMGALSHLVIISQDLQTFVHSHPLDMDDDHDEDGHGEGDGHAHGHGHAGHDHSAIMRLARESVALANGKPTDAVFHVVFPNPGLYKAFAQFQHGGRILTYPFVIDAEPAGVVDHDHAPTPAGAEHSGHGDHK